jgi:hypothetical protein
MPRLPIRGSQQLFFAPADPDGSFRYSVGVRSVNFLNTWLKYWEEG